MPITHSSEPAKLREAAEALAKAFAGFFALAYVSGYLIVSAHLEALGIRSSGVSVVKAKYIWMGFLYLLPLLFLTAITALVWLTPPPSFRTLLWRFERTGRATTYKNRYPYVVSFMVMFLGSRMVFFFRYGAKRRHAGFSRQWGCYFRSISFTESSFIKPTSWVRCAGRRFLFLERRPTRKKDMPASSMTAWSDVATDRAISKKSSFACLLFRSAAPFAMS